MQIYILLLGLGLYLYDYYYYYCYDIDSNIASNIIYSIPNQSQMFAKYNTKDQYQT